MEQSQQFNEREFDSETVYGDKHIKTKIKMYNDKIIKSFHSD